MSAPITTFLQRKDFPDDFTIGAASSAFQVEGAAREGGRGPSIWDTFCEQKGWQVGEAIDHFRRYKEDVAMMKWIGLDTYRFSISWSRIMPDGVNVNFEGIKFYHELIGELRRNGITPFVTLFHWDTPQALEDKYGGFRSEQIVDDFGDYADTCFKFFGSDVKNWITLNEPWSFTEGGYASGNHAPGRGYQEDPNPPTGKKTPRYPRGATEPYLVTHYQLLAHARAVQIYRERYNRSKDGQIGIALNSVWFAPATDSEKDKQAVERAFDFQLNWFLYPITKGEYPQGMAKIMKERKLPYKFSKRSCVKDSMDFLGINYYIACYVRDKPDIEKEHGENFTTDYNTEYPPEPSLGEEFPGSVGWLKVYPQGLKDLMFRIKKEYPGPIYITENGYGENNDDNLPHHEALHDNHRLYYIHHHLSQISEITKEDAPNKVNVKGYFAWTLWDNFEWAGRFDIRFGNIYVDYKNNLERTPKFSAHWLKYVLWREPRKKGPGLIDTGNEPTTRSSSRRSTSMSSVSSRSSSMSSTKKVHPATSVTARTRPDLGFGMSPVRSTLAQSQNCGLTTRTSSLSRCALESEPESEEENESDNSDDITNSSELESGLENEEDFESDNDSDPARGASDNSNESEEDVTSFPSRCYTKASIKCSGRKY